MMYEAEVRKDYRNLYEQTYEFLTKKMASREDTQTQEESADVESL